MSSRLDLHELLCTALGSRNVYFQPPESLKMQYPAIVYSRSDIDNGFADDGVYKQLYAYTVTVIDKNPDSAIVGNISRFPSCRFDRHFTADNLNHDTFKLYY